MTSTPWFSGALDLRAYKPGEWVLLEDFKYHARSGEEFVVPRWFITDLASIPWLVQPMFDDVEHREAGVVHDWLYCTQLVSRQRADELFREMVEVLGCGTTRSGLMYAGLRAGGWSHWDNTLKGAKQEDFAWEFMSRAERVAMRLAYINDRGVPPLKVPV